MLESNRKKIWTIPRLQGSIKAAFLTRALRDRTDEYEIELRYRDLKSVLSVSEGAVSDRTLSRALAGLVTSGHLKKQGTGKLTRYKIFIPRPDLIAASAKADGNSISLGAQIGAVGRLDEGWAFYGVPESLANKLRPILRREANAFRERVSGALDKFAGSEIRKIVKQAKGRMPRAAILAGEEGLWKILQRSTIFAMLTFGGNRFWDWIEQTHPGALRLVNKTFGLEQSTSTRLEVRVVDLVRVWTALTGVPEAKLRLGIEKETKAFGRHLRAANRLLQTLPPSRRAKTVKVLGDLAPLGGALSGVIHHL